MKRLLIYLALTPLLFFLASTPVSATNESCKAIFGGGTTCIQDEQLLVDVAVQDPQFTRYVDNLTASESKYTPGQIVLLKITVKNDDAKKKLSKITVTNTFPQHITYNTASGKYDEKNRSITWTIEALAPKEEKIFYAQGIVNKNIPQNPTCVIDQAVATSGKLRSQDNAGFCIDRQAVLAVKTQKPATPQTSKGGLPVYQPTQTKKTPDTGPEMLALFGLVPAAAAGFWLRKKTTISQEA